MTIAGIEAGFTNKAWSTLTFTANVMAMCIVVAFTRLLTIFTCWNVSRMNECLNEQKFMNLQTIESARTTIGTNFTSPT